MASIVREALCRGFWFGAKESNRACVSVSGDLWRSLCMLAVSGRQCLTAGINGLGSILPCFCWMS